MTDPISYQQPTMMLPFNNRSGSLIASGILILLAGVFSGCIAAATPFVSLVDPQSGMHELNIRQLLPGMILYAAMSVILIWLGIGLLKRRRWSRPLALILATHWLVLGVGTILLSIALFPLTRDTLSADPNMPPGVINGILIAGLGFTFLLLIALPGVILWMLKSDDVRLTVEHFDPTPRWTDRCPIKILGLSLTLYVAAICFLLAAFNATLPIGGVLLQGPAAIAVIVLITALLVLSGYWCYRLDFRGWWLGLLTITLTALAMLPSVLMIPPIQIYRAMGTPKEQLGVIADHEQLLKLSFAAFLILFVVTFGIYMLRMRPVMQAARET